MPDLDKSLRYTHKLRKRIIKDYMKQMGHWSKDDGQVMTSLLDGVDRAVLARARLTQQKQSLDNQQAQQRMVGDILRSIGGENPAPPQVELDNTHVVDLKVVGETEINADPLVYSEFVPD